MHVTPACTFWQMDNFIPTHHTCADSFEVGVILSCVILLLLIALTAVGWIFMRKDESAKEVNSAIPSQSDSGSVGKDAIDDFEH